MTPALPPEIWRIIFRQATYVPMALETDIGDPFDQPQPPVSPEEETLSDTTKKSLVQVCHTWRSLSLEFLYERINITHMKSDVTGWMSVATTLERLGDVLRGSKHNAEAEDRENHQKSAIANGPHELGYGFWTKRIDVPSHAFATSNPACLIPIFFDTPNLSILRIYHPDIPGLDEPSLCHASSVLDFSQRITRLFPETLRRLCFPLTEEHFERYSLAFTHARHLPAIEYTTLQLALTGTTYLDPQPSCIGTVRSLELYLTEYIDQIPAWHFPSLIHLTLDNLGDRDTDGLRRVGGFLDLNGPQLRSLTLKACEGDLILRLPTLLECMPHLETLCFSPWEIGAFVTTGAFPSVRQVGVAGFRPLPGSARAKYPAGLGETLFSPAFFEAFSGLERVRFFKWIEDVAFDQPGAKSILNRCIQHNVAVEDPHRKRLNVEAS